MGKHTYIANLAESLITEIHALGDLITYVDQIKLLADSDVKELSTIRAELEKFLLRKEIELENFNQKQNQGLLDYNIEAEEKRIEEEKRLFDRLTHHRFFNFPEKNIPFYDALTILNNSLNERSKWYRKGKSFIDSNAFITGTRLAEVADESWDGARGFLEAKFSQTLSVFVSIPISTLTFSIMFKESVEETHHAVGKFQKEIQLKNPAEEQSKITQEAKRPLWGFRSVIGGTKATLAGAAVAGSLFSFGVSALAYVIAMPFAVSLAAAGFLAAPPFIVITICGLSYLQNKEDYFFAKQREKEAKKKFETMKKKFETIKSDGYIADPAGYITDKEKFLKVDKSVLKNEKFLPAYRAEQTYFKYQQKRKVLRAEGFLNKVTMGCIAFGAVGGLLLSISAFGALSAATLGVFPTVLLTAGSVLALGMFVFEKIDEANNFKYTNKILDFKKNMTKGLKSLFSNDKPKQEMQLAMTSPAPAISMTERINQLLQLEEKNEAESFSQRVDAFYTKQNNKEKATPKQQTLNLPRLDALYQSLHSEDEKKQLHEAAWAAISQKQDWSEKQIEAFKQTALNSKVLFHGLSFFSTKEKELEKKVEGFKKAPVLTHNK